MKRIFKVLLLLLIGLTFYTQFTPLEVNATITPDDNGNWYWGYQSALNDTYYADLVGVDTNDSSEFKDALHLIISSGCNVGSYDDAKRSLAILDEDPNDSNSILCIYTGLSILKSNFASNNNANYWNREHVWAKSYGFPEKSYDAHNDIHHLRACQMSANSRRNNRGFDDIEGGSVDIYGSTISGSDWYEPRAEVKGDVARIMMYMEVRYNGDSLSDGVSLTLTNSTSLSTSKGSGKLGKLDTLLKWHVEDPVDDLERQRNDKAYEIQGNRNPFVDHPEYANYIYGTNYQVDQDNELTVTYQCDSSTSFNYVDNTIYTSGSIVKMPTTTPVKEGFDFIGWYSDKKLTNAWDFATSKIYNDLVLYPKFVADIDPKDAFEALTLDAKMAVKASESIGGSFEEKEMVINGFYGDGQFSGTNTTVDLKDHCEFDVTLFDIKFNTNNNTYGYIGGSANHLRLYVGNGTPNGGSVNITSKNGIVITNVTYTTTSHEKDTSADMVTTIAQDGSEAILQNTNSGNGGHVRITSITIKYQEESSSYEIESTKLTYRYQISDSLVAELKALDANVKFGIMINDKKYDLEVKDGYVTGKYMNVDIDTIYQVCGYVCLDGKYLYTEMEDYSIKALALRYLQELGTDKVVSDNRGLLNFLAK